MIAGDNDNSDKFFACINNTGKQLMPLTTTLAINLSPISTIPVNHKVPEVLTSANNLLLVSLTLVISFSLMLLKLVISYSPQR